MYYPFIFRTYTSVLLAILIVLLAIIVVGIVGGWFVYKKAGREGWAAIIPIYTTYILYEITWGNGILGLIYVALAVIGALGWPIISLLCTLMVVALNIFTFYKLAKAFGEGIPFTVGLVLLSPIFMLILGLSANKYQGVPQDGYTYDDLKAKVSAHMNSSTPANGTPGTAGSSYQSNTDTTAAHKNEASSAQPDAQEATETVKDQPSVQPEEKKSQE